jgi:hypothetical protein
VSAHVLIEPSAAPTTSATPKIVAARRSRALRRK